MADSSLTTYRHWYRTALISWMRRAEMPAILMEVHSMKIDGGCHCGYISYEAEADPQRAFICHCTDCQELSGSAFRIGIRIASDDFRMLSGEPTIYAKTAESGAKS